MNRSETDTLSSSSSSSQNPSQDSKAASATATTGGSSTKRAAFKQSFLKIMNQMNIIRTDGDKVKDNGEDTTSLSSVATNQSTASTTSTNVSDVYKNGELARRREKKKLAQHKIEGWLGDHKPFTEFLEYLAYEELRAAAMDGGGGAQSPAIETVLIPPTTPTQSIEVNRPKPMLSQKQQQQTVVRRRAAVESDQSTDEDDQSTGSTDESESNNFEDDFQKLLQLKRQTPPAHASSSHQLGQFRRQLEKDPEFRQKLDKFNRFKVLDIDVEFAEQQQDFLADLNQINPLEIIDVNNEYICYTNKFYQMNHFNFIGKYEYEKSRNPSTSKNNTSGDSVGGESDDFDAEPELLQHSPSSHQTLDSSETPSETGHPVFVLSLHSESSNQIECILRTRSGNKIGTVELQEGESWNVANILSRLDKNMFIKEIKPVIHPHATELIAKFDKKLIKPNFTFGIVYQKLGQMDEKEIFSNTAHSPEFDEFLEFIGRKVELKDFQGFRGGLDKANNTGEYSVYEEFSSSEIMFHVSTMLPHSARDTQQIERKRHIGNDRVCIVFQDEYTPFTPEMLPTNLLHVFIVIQPGKLEDGSRCYQLTVISKSDVPDIEPFIRKPFIFKKDEYLKKFLLTKLINAEYASLKAKAFYKFQIKTMDIWLKELYASLKKMNIEFTGDDYAHSGNIERQLINSINSLVGQQQQQFLSVAPTGTNRLSPNGPLYPDSLSPVAPASLTAVFSTYSVKQQFLILKNLESIFNKHLQSSPGEFESLLPEQLIGTAETTTTTTSKPSKYSYGKPRSNVIRRIGDTFNLSGSSKSSFKAHETESTHSMDSLDNSASSVGTLNSSFNTGSLAMVGGNGYGSSPSSSMLQPESAPAKAPVHRKKTKRTKTDEEINQQKRSTLTADPDDPSSSSMVSSQTFDSPLTSTGQSSKKDVKENLKKYTHIVLSSEKYQTSDKKKQPSSSSSAAASETLKKPTTLGNILTNTAQKPLNTVKSALPKQVNVLDFGMGDANENESSDSDSEATQKSANHVDAKAELSSPPATSGSKTIATFLKSIGRRKDADQTHAKLSESSSSNQRRRRSIEYEEAASYHSHSNQRNERDRDQLKTKF